MLNKVVITGVGSVSPIGNSYQSTVNALFSGISGITFDSQLNASTAVVANNIDETFDRYDLQTTDRFARAALQSYYQAKADSGTSVDGVYIGSGAGAATEIQRVSKEFHTSARVRPNSLVSTMGSGAASLIAFRDNITGPVFTYQAACSSSSIAIGEAYKAIAYGEVDVMAAGGTEFCVTSVVIEQWRAMRALGTKSAPFSADRNGIIVGEGSSIFILENYERAVQRGAKIYGQIVGYGVSCGSESITKPSKAGQILAINRALKDIDHSMVTYINAHGTGTPVGDLVELNSISDVFGDKTSHIPVSSTKTLHGHQLGNAGAMELIACLGVIERNQIVPNWGLTNPDAEIPDNINLPTTVVNKQQDICLNNSFAFGGTNVVLAIKKLT